MLKQYYVEIAFLCDFVAPTVYECNTTAEIQIPGLQQCQA